MAANPQELPPISLELGNQDLKEIIEVASQITAQLEVENIVKNVVLSFVARFQSAGVTVILPNDLDEGSPSIHHYRGLKREALELKIPALKAVLAFLERHEYNQISFGYFQETCRDTEAAEGVQALQALAPDIVIPLRTDKAVGGLILLPGRSDGEGYGLLDIQYITQITRFASIAIENANLYWQATTDRMTKLFSHHYFQQTLEEEVSRALRYKSAFSLIMLDIDHFKKFNDTYGHLQGDRIIKEIARILRRSVRTVDFTARYGGEEFAVVLPQVDAKGAAVVAERIRAAIDAHEFAGEEGPLHVSVSIGVAEFKPQRMRSPSQLIAEADKALYQSKELGRNRITIHK